MSSILLEEVNWTFGTSKFTLSRDQALCRIYAARFALSRISRASHKKRKKKDAIEKVATLGNKTQQRRRRT
jgi:hypothetical protein